MKNNSIHSIKHAQNQSKTYWDVFKLINEVPIKEVFCIKVPKHTLIYRTRINKNEGNFSQVEQLSYPKYSMYYGRANRPGFPMFYGAISMYNEAPFHQVYTTFAESINFLNNCPEIQERKVTIGTWITTEDLFFVGMVYHDNFNKGKLDLIELKSRLIRYYINRNEKDMPMILDYFGKEFAKGKINNDSDYIITAAFVESLLKKAIYEIDGIIYPSVKSHGQFFNIAIKSKSVDQFMLLTHVVTATLYCLNDFVIPDYEKEAHLKPGDTNFELTACTEFEGKESSIAKLLEITGHKDFSPRSSNL